jgi:hypothetical protein
VQRIETYAGEVPDTVYVRHSHGWKAQLDRDSG